MNPFRRSLLALVLGSLTRGAAAPVDSVDPTIGGGQGGRAYYDENNAYTYNWDVLHDFAGLCELMGGLKAAEGRLDELFRAGLGRSKYEFFAKFPDSTAMVGQFSMANEPSLSPPYLYNRVGAPETLPPSSALVSPATLTAN